MPTVTKKVAENTTKQDIEKILETSKQLAFVVSDLENTRAHAIALYFTGFDTRAYRAKSIYLINAASSLMTDDDYRVEVKRLDSGSYHYTLSKNA